MRPLSVAQHEAAHAVVGVYLGLSLRVVRVDPKSNAEVDGYAHFRKRKTEALPYAIMCAAGPAADAIHGRNEPESWTVDYSLIRESGFTARERRILIDIATRYLKGPCRKPWKRVTDALTERDLTGAEIKALIVHGEKLDV